MRGLLVLLVLAMSSNAFSQATTTLGGTVQDASGALIPGVEVTAVDNATGVARTAITNETGTYAFAAMQPGTYTVKAALTGFGTKSFTQVALSANQTNRLKLCAGGRSASHGHRSGCLGRPAAARIQSIRRRPSDGQRDSQIEH